MTGLKDAYLLDPEVAFLNHGSFGATPRPVFAAYRRWQRALERRPVQFLVEELPGHLQVARTALAEYLAADPADLLLIPNATFGVNLVARSLALQPGDVVLTTDHEYGACERVWRFVCQKQGAELARRPLPLPLADVGSVMEALFAGVTDRTRVIFLSHMTSPTAQRLPVEAVCRRARALGLVSVVDGAHAPGQIPVDLRSIDADFYVGNCHKWLSAPKGSAFLHARRERQPALEPLVVSWGWGEDSPLQTGSPFQERLEWWGTHDPAAALTVPDAIRFQAEHDWPAVRRRCHAMLSQAMDALAETTGQPSLYVSPAGYAQMAAARLPPLRDAPALKARLYAEYRVEVPLIEWNGLDLIRISVQAYNEPSDLERLQTGLDRLLPAFNR